VERAVATGVPLRVCVLPFLERMELAYALADLTVTRAGATSIAEMTVCGLPMILVPYPHATENHQQANAVEMVRAGAALMELDADLTSQRLAARIVELVDDAARRERMAQASAAWGRPDADLRLAALVLEHAR
jgi:UDP-N-acetylglucosamine--N-acetylmuramyl-(pentapeptide) pyrophosphoryl-undecaprenol N-acetylglucosamine transferase